jgi:hypothetical protein
MTYTLPVHSYYALFNALRAFSVIRGSSLHTHTSLHRQFANSGLDRLPLPWSASLAGDPQHIDQCRVTPADSCTPCECNPIQATLPSEAYLFTALRMTRRWKLDLARLEWLRTNRRPNGERYQRLPAGARQQLAAQQRPTTLLDFLYELRRRANYERADEYIAEVSDMAVQRFHRGVLFLTDSGLLVVEAQIAAYIGIDALRSLVEAWAFATGQHLGSWATTSVRNRVEAIAAWSSPV